ncbi:MAG: alpha/beta hydrolase [Clostridia bacterium]|nr:alpha/beta hydrolase [Clostridia bacterium]
MIPELSQLPMNPTLAGQAELLENIRYSENGQTLSLLLPWAPHDNRENQAPHPLIVFVQGSAWTTPNLCYEIPMLSRYAEEGFAVATVSHRSTTDGHPFPAFLIDVKCAIRFLRANAKTYAIDPTRVLAFGTSSGGNTVCLLGLTGDDPEFRTEEYSAYSDSVDAVVSCFAPTDLPALFDYLKDMPDANAILGAYFGSDPGHWHEEMEKYSPVNRVRPGNFPPFLLLHGTGDTLVPCSQMETLYLKMKEAGLNVKAAYVTGAEHEGNFWSPQVRTLIHETILRQLTSRKE